MAHPVYLLTLWKSYYSKGFFNLGVDVDGEICSDENAEIVLNLEGAAPIAGRMNRTANLNGTPRIRGGAALRDWFVSNYSMNETIKVEIPSPTELRLSSLEHT